MEGFNAANPWWGTFLHLLLAFVLGGVIGLERQYRQRTAGLRTNVLVAVGAALFVDTAKLSYAIYGSSPTPLHVMAYVVSGVGFLGAGVIMREEGHVRGLNTAATLWGSAAVGVASGAGQYAAAVLGTLFVLAANVLLRPVLERLNRVPLDASAVEATHTVTVIVDRRYQRFVRDRFEALLERYRYPASDWRIEPFGDHDVLLEATLTASSVDTGALEKLVQRLTALPGVAQAFWTPSTEGVG